MIIVKSNSTILFQLMKPNGDKLWKEMTNANPWGFVLDCGRNGSYICEPGNHIGSCVSINGWSIRYLEGSSSSDNNDK